MAYRKEDKYGTKVRRSGPGKEIDGEACLPDVPHEVETPNGGADSTLPILSS
jgi:hypothetical protein